MRVERGKLRVESRELRGRRRWPWLIAAAAFFIAQLSTLNPQLSAAVNDRVIVCASVAAGAFADTAPGAGVQRSIVWIKFEDNIELQFYDGSTQWLLEAFTGPGVYDAQASGLAATSTMRPRIKNTHGSAAKQICYQYLETK